MTSCRVDQLLAVLYRLLFVSVTYAHYALANRNLRGGTAFFERVCKLDLEGIVAKHAFGTYTTDERTTWFKIKNRNYSQMAGREKLFDRERHREPAPGWHSCELACAELGQG